MTGTKINCSYAQQTRAGSRNEYSARQWRTIGTVGQFGLNLQSQARAFVPKLQSTVPHGVNDAADLSTELLFQRWPPRHELKAEPIVDHRETARTQREPLTIDTGNMFTFGGRR